MEKFLTEESMIDVIKLSQVLNSRLCHQIAGTVGAVNNLADLIDSYNNKIKKQASILIKQNSERLANQLIYYRYAYGFSNDTEVLNAVDIKKITTKSLSLKENGIEFKVTNLLKIPIEVNIAKLLMCLIISAYNNIVKDGMIEIELQHVRGYKLKIKAIGGQQKIEDETITALTNWNEKIDLTVFNSHECYIYHLIQKTGCKLVVNQLDDAVEYCLNQ